MNTAPQAESTPPSNVTPLRPSMARPKDNRTDSQKNAEINMLCIRHARLERELQGLSLQAQDGPEGKQLKYNKLRVKRRLNELGALKNDTVPPPMSLVARNTQRAAS